MSNLSRGSSKTAPSKRSDDKKIGMNQVDIRVYRRELSSQEKSQLEKSMRGALQERMGKKREEKLAQIEENKSKTNARKAACSASLEKKQQEVRAKLGQHSKKE